LFTNGKIVIFGEIISQQTNLRDMNQFRTFLILFIVFSSALTNFSFAQGLNPLQGENVKPNSVSIDGMLLYNGPAYFVEPREKTEGEPPYAPSINAPNAWDISNVTVDKINNVPQLSPVLGTGFEGITQAGYIPSEPTAAVGPTQVFSPGNVNVTITNKDGSGRTEIAGTTFFGVGSTEGAISDAVCCYDAVRGRFVALCFTQGNSGGKKWSNYYLMISKTSDATGAWWQYKFDWTKDGSNSTSNWGDFEEFGFSADKFVMSSQQFSFRGNSYKYQKLRVIDINALYSGSSVTWVDFVNFPAPSGGDISSLFVTKPGRNISAGDNNIYLLTTRYNGGGTVAYRTITGTASGPVLSAGSLVNVNTYGASVNAKGGSSTASVACGDCRTSNFIVRNGSLHIAWHFGINFGSGSVDAVRYLKLNVTNISSPVKVTDETFGADGIFYYYPSCTADSYGNMFIGFGRSSGSEFPASWVSGKRTTDASIEPSIIAKQGASVTSQSRWGDYTGIDMDETASNSTQSVAWYAGQWTKSSNVFGTWVSQMKFASPTVFVQNHTPDNFSVQNYPNPFNPVTQIKYSLPYGAFVTLKVIDITGREIASLVSDFQSTGYYSASFDGSGIASGIYFYHLTAVSGANKFEKTMKMILTK